MSNMSRHTLLSTVGTSLLGNLERVEKEKHPALVDAFERRRAAPLADELQRFEPSKRLCGAEINLFHEIIERRRLPELLNLFLLVSDTEKGAFAGQVLEHYFEHEGLNVECHTIDRLQDQDPKRFKTTGLRNLVRKMGELVQRVGGPRYVAIDATGGYKAQIALAVLLGQVLDVPVFYKHERFSELIDFPSLPVSFDYDLLGRNADLLASFEKGAAFSEAEIGEVEEKLRALLVEVEVDDQHLYELSPIGQIYLTGFRQRYAPAVDLKPSMNRKLPSFRDDHYPIGFKSFVRKVWKENNWIRTATSLPYHGQRGIRRQGIGFHIKEVEGEQQLIGTYVDRNDFGARFRLFITDDSPRALSVAADRLNQKYNVAS